MLVFRPAGNVNSVGMGQAGEVFAKQKEVLPACLTPILTIKGE
jgi:hypothetical protein